MYISFPAAASKGSTFGRHFPDNKRTGYDSVEGTNISILPLSQGVRDVPTLVGGGGWYYNHL